MIQVYGYSVPLKDIVNYGRKPVNLPALPDLSEVLEDVGEAAHALDIAICEARTKSDYRQLRRVPRHTEDAVETVLVLMDDVHLSAEDLKGFTEELDRKMREIVGEIVQGKCPEPGWYTVDGSYLESPRSALMTNCSSLGTASPASRDKHMSSEQNESAVNFWDVRVYGYSVPLKDIVNYGRQRLNLPPLRDDTEVVGKAAWALDTAICRVRVESGYKQVRRVPRHTDDAVETVLVLMDDRHLSAGDLMGFTEEMVEKMGKIVGGIVEGDCPEPGWYTIDGSYLESPQSALMGCCPVSGAARDLFDHHQV